MNNITSSHPSAPALDDDLEPVDAVALARLLTAAGDVQRRHQFFVWVQTFLQPLLPRAVLACGSYSRSRRALCFDVFNTVVVAKALNAELCDPQSELLSNAVEAWLAGGCKPAWLAAGAIVHSTEVVAELHRLVLPQLLVHGVSRPQRPTELESFFVFADADWQPQARDLRCLDMVLPCMHATYLRVLAVEQMVGAKPSAPAVAASRSPLGLLTRRELQVLACVREGLSNADIGQALGISGLTAKNHVQSILQKLGATSRAHAVARADSMGALRGLAAVAPLQVPRQDGNTLCAPDDERR